MINIDKKLDKCISQLFIPIVGRYYDRNGISRIKR